MLINTVSLLKWPVRAGELLIYDVNYTDHLLQWPVRAGGKLLIYDAVDTFQLLQWPVLPEELLIYCVNYTDHLLQWPVRAGELRLLAYLNFWLSVFNLRIGNFCNSSFNLKYENIWRQYIYLRRSSGTENCSVSSMFIKFIIKIVGILHV